MPAEDKAGNEPIDGAIDELLQLQHDAQNAPVHDLAHDVISMYNELADTLNAFNELVAAEPCSCGCTSAGAKAVLAQTVKLTISIAIYSLGIGQRSPNGFHIGQRPASTDLN
jgi:hypothetical protein